MNDFELQSRLEFLQHIELENNLYNLPKEKTIVVYCWETWCNLGAKSAIKLLENGYNVKELVGGIAAWKTLNLDIEQL